MFFFNFKHCSVPLHLKAGTYRLLILDLIIDIDNIMTIERFNL